MLFIITISTFVCITLGAMAAYWLMFRPASAATERLKRMSEGNGASASRPAPSLVMEESAVSALAERWRRRSVVSRRLQPPKRKKLAKQLMHAGYRSPNAPIIYRSLQLVSLAFFPAAVALGCAMVGKPIANAAMWILGAFVFGFMLPRYMLNRMIKSRQQRLQWGLADALDLLVVSIEAGLGLNSALVRVGEEMKEVHPDISEEFAMTNMEIRVGRDRAEALRNLAERTGVEDLRSLCAMLIQADKFGTSIARAVRVYRRFTSNKA